MSERSGPFSREFAEDVERLPGRIGNFLKNTYRYLESDKAANDLEYALNTAGAYLGSEKAAEDYTKLLRGEVFSTAAEPPTEVEPATEVEEPSIVGGLDLNRPKPFAMTPEGQFERYFQTPEFDYVFGAGARGKDAPDSASAMQQLAAQEKAPMEQPLSSYYAAQSAMGRVNQDAIQNMYEGDENMQAWAKANPMLAQREYLKSEQRRANEMPLAPDDETVLGDLGGRAQGPSGYTPESLGLDKPQGARTPEEAKLKLFKRAKLNK